MQASKVRRLNLDFKTPAVLPKSVCELPFAAVWATVRSQEKAIMTNVVERAYYVYKGQPVVVDDLIVIAEGGSTELGTLQYHNAWGGFVHSISQDDFATKFVRVPDEEIQSLLKTFEAIDVSIGDDCEESVPAYTNGERWNGWLVPYLSLETILEATSGDGMLVQRGMDRVARFLYIPDRDDLLEISSYEGGEFDAAAIKSLNLARIREIATTVPAQEADILYQGMGLIVSTARKASVVEDGKDRPTTVYNIGNGWCWDVAMPPSPNVKPTSPSP